MTIIQKLRCAFGHCSTEKECARSESEKVVFHYDKRQRDRPGFVLVYATISKGLKITYRCPICQSTREANYVHRGQQRAIYVPLGEWTKAPIASKYFDPQPDFPLQLSELGRQFWPS